MDKALIRTIEEQLGTRIQSCQPLSGGDISAAYLLQSPDAQFFCKFNNGKFASDMFQAEKEGLEAIAQSGFIDTPEIFYCGQSGSVGILLMEYVEAKNPSPKEMTYFGELLAHMHGDIQARFGWEKPNFIGSLDQSNNWHPDWPTFYIEERLLPQLRLAVTRKLLPPGEVPSIKQMHKAISGICGHVKPSLLHGDLWGGNFLIALDGRPYLIDPAVYYGHSEVDLAMSKLFGGFSNAFYEGYHAGSKQAAGIEVRMEIYQLYYLLVHLNLFGRSYYHPVKHIIGKYFGS